MPSDDPDDDLPQLLFILPLLHEWLLEYVDHDIAPPCHRVRDILWLDTSGNTMDEDAISGGTMPGGLLLMMRDNSVLRLTLEQTVSGDEREADDAH
jgi:hypothetical protein